MQRGVPIYIWLNSVTRYLQSTSRRVLYALAGTNLQVTNDSPVTSSQKFKPAHGALPDAG